MGRETGKRKCKAYTYTKKTGETKKCKKNIEYDKCKKNECDNHKKNECDYCEKDECDCNCGCNQTYCKTHLYFEDFSENDIENIANGTSDFFVCSHCNKWTPEKPCIHCHIKNQDNDGTSAREIEKENRNECCIMIKRFEDQEPYKCTYAVLDDKSSKFDSLLNSFDIKDQYYIDWIKKNNILCKRHLQKYLKEMYENYLIYTHADFDEFKWCSTCRNYKNPDKFIGGLCIGCFEKSQKDNLTEIEARKLHDRCLYENCNNEQIRYKERSDEEWKVVMKSNDLNGVFSFYCGKHQIEGWKYTIENGGKKVCSHYVRGCRSVLNVDDFESCENCREKIRIYDKMRRDEKKIVAKNLEKELNDEEKRNLKVCIYCPYDDNIHFLEDFITNDIEYAMCICCREYTRNVDKNRIKRKRNWKKKLENSLEKKEKNVLEKKEISNLGKKEKNDELIKLNREKKNEQSANYRIRRKERLGLEEYSRLMREKSANYRSRRKEKLGLEECLRLMREQTRKWKENNPEKWKARQENYRKNLDKKILTYKRDAKIRNLEFLLTDEQCYTFFNSKCVKCKGKNHDDSLCGIDRINNDKGYIIENCEACCTMCNMMKCDMTNERLVRKAIHILNYLEIIETDEYYPEEFDDHTSVSYTRYLTRSSKKDMNFELTYDEFISIIAMDCYLCGKESDDYHLNGIDRINNDNNIGYVFNNVMPCCTECNCMKYKYDLFDFVFKLYEIYVNSENVEQNLTKDDISEMMKEYIRDKNDEIQHNINLTKNEDEPIIKSINSLKIKSTKKDTISANNNDSFSDSFSDSDSDDNNVKTIKTKNASTIKSLLNGKDTQKSQVLNFEILKDNMAKKSNIAKISQKRTHSEQKEYDKIRKQKYRAKNSKNKKPKQKRTPSEKREYDRIRKQKYRTEKK